MSIPRVCCVVLGLGLGLLFYLAFRSEHTLSNRLVISVCGAPTYFALKHELRHWLPVPTFLRGCLPSGLWCLIATCLLGGWKIRLGRTHVLQLAWLCPLFNTCWESIQWIGWTDGHADWLDVLAGFVGWSVARLLFLRSARPADEIPALWNWRVGVVVTGFACIGLADVWK